jgi:hypothetical protein
VGDLRISSKEETSRDGRGTSLVLWESQHRFLKEVAAGLDQGQKIFKVLKSRQLGVTTVSLAVDLFWVAMHPGITMAIVTDTEGNREKNRTLLAQYVKSFPEGYFGEFNIVQNNRQMMRFSNGSRFDFKVAGTKDKGTAWAEGEGYAAAHITELANFGSPDGLRSFEEAFAQNNPDSIYIYESTAKGHNIWYDTWMAGFKDPHKQRSFFVGWWANPNNAFKKSDPRFAEFGLEKPTREEQDLIDTVKTQHDYAVSAEQLAWYRYRQSSADTTADGTLEQNQPWTAGQAFIMTGQSFFNVRTLTKDTQQIIEAQQQEGGGGYGWVGYNYDFGLSFFDMEMVEATDDDDPNDIELRVWEPPKKEGRYVIGCDPAYGRNEHKDRSAISVWRCYADKLVQVAEYASYLTEVDKVAWVLAHIAGCYTDCMVNLDIGGPGRMIMHEWKHLEQMINSEAYADRAKKGGWEDALSNARWYLYNKPDSMGAGYVYNFEASFRTKQELMHGLRGSYITREMLVRSLPLLREMGNVVQDGSSIEAPESSNPEKKDDRVFSAGLAVRAWHNWRRSEMLAENLTYERVMAEETGAITQQARSLNGLVARYFAWQQALDDEDEYVADNRPQWKTDRGLA